MAIKKQFVKSKPVCKVTFVIDAKNASSAAVVGDFNNWDANLGVFSKLKNGTFKVTLDLNKDASYEFKYLIDGNYLNESEADSFRWNDYAGSENSVVVV